MEEKKDTETAEKAESKLEKQADSQNDAQAEEAPAEGTAEAAPQKRKINQMTPAEIDAKLAQLQETQGGLESKYAQHLLARKASLKS